MTRLMVFTGLLSLNTIAVSQPAFADGFVKLSKPAKSSVQSIGIVPKEKPKVLNLGVLRTGEATLPGGNTSFEQRMEMRRRLALKRQQEVATATRK